jgi:hypothetical protein
MSNDVEIEVEVRAETPKALLVYNGSTEVWVPKSQIRDQCENDLGTITSIFISEWLATEKGLV